LILNTPAVSFFKAMSVLLLSSILLFANPLQAGATAAVANTDSGANNYQALADVLSDPASRDKLIEELRNLSEQSDQQSQQEGSGEAQDQQNEDASAQVDDAATDVAKQTQSVVEVMVTTLTSSWSAMTDLVTGDNNKAGSFISTLLKLAVVIAATIAAYVVLRVLARVLFRRADSMVANNNGSNPLMIKAGAIVLGVITDVVVVLLAWLAGYAAALLFVGEMGEVTVVQTLFLNVFLAVEFFKVLVRAVFAARDDSLRLLPMTTPTARFWSGFITSLVSLVGYGTLLVVPLISNQLSAELGALTNLLIVLVALSFALTVVRRQRDHVREGLSKLSQQANFSMTRVTLGVLSRSWHWLAYLYFLAMSAALLIQPEQALPQMLMATLQTVLAVLIGMSLIGLLQATLGQQVKVPAMISARLSTFEQRLNQFLPTLNKVLKGIILVMVISAVLDAWGAVDLPTWLASPAGTHVLSTIISVLFILASATMFWMVLASWIEHRLNPEEGRGEPSAREKTLLTIFRNATAIAIIVMTLMIVLSEIGINIGPLLAGAGVLGLAIGFGAQKLVQDVITGVFIQMENAINAGDIVTAGGLTGTAEKLTIRSLGLRDLSGTYHVIPFSSVDTVSNYMREFAYHVGEYGVAYREDTDEVVIKLREAFAELLSIDEQREKILSDELEVHGVTALADSSVNIRVRIKTLPGNQWAVGREYNRLVKRHLDAAGIEIPFPHLTLYFGEDKQGQAPAMPLKMLNEVEVVNDAQVEQLGAQKKAKSADKSAESNPTEKGDFDDGE
jgi:small conductance mechanosensitive channel